MKCENCSRKKLRTEEEHKKLINRLSRIEGQVRGIKRMVEEDAYCIDILTQLAAIKASLSSFTSELLFEHMRSCVKNDVVKGNDDLLEEAISTMQKLMK
jgi:DNA-binding FrmR family transcriptional regulator